MYLGPDEILLNLEADFKDDLSGSEIESAVERLETTIRTQHPDVRRIFLEATALARGRRGLRPA
jgi:hypothetical protein